MRSFKPELCRRPNPRVRHVAGAIADERDGFARNRPPLFLECENVRENLARMLVVRQRVDGRDAGKLGEFLDVALREGADDRAVNHAAQHARGVLDRLAAAKLNVIGIEKHGPAAEFVDADLKRTRVRVTIWKTSTPRFDPPAAGFCDDRARA